MMLKKTRRKPWKRAGIAGAAASLILAGAMLTPSTSNAADTFPSEDACHVTNNNTPVGDCGLFKQLYHENFNNANVAVGAFSNCGGDYDYQCQGLAGTRYYDTLGAYPSGWPDTARQWYGTGGYYRPESTVSVYTNSSGDGMMRVHMYRPSSGGANKVAAVVPRPCINLRYGKFTERFVVRQRTNGFKMAHLHYGNNDEEIDYPEAGGNFATDPISVFTHTFDESSGDVAPNSSWTSAHTYSQEIVPGQIRIYFDGKLMKTINADYPSTTPWVLQNESALDGSQAAPGSSVDIDTTFVTCYKYDSTLAKATKTLPTKKKNR